MIPMKNNQKAIDFITSIHELVVPDGVGAIGIGVDIEGAAGGWTVVIPKRWDKRVNKAPMGAKQNN